MQFVGLRQLIIRPPKIRPNQGQRTGSEPALVEIFTDGDDITFQRQPSRGTLTRIGVGEESARIERKFTSINADAPNSMALKKQIQNHMYSVDDIRYHLQETSCWHYRFSANNVFG